MFFFAFFLSLLVAFLSPDLCLVPSMPNEFSTLNALRPLNIRKNGCIGFVQMFVRPYRVYIRYHL